MLLLPGGIRILASVDSKVPMVGGGVSLLLGRGGTSVSPLGLCYSFAGMDRRTWLLLSFVLLWRKVGGVCHPPMPTGWWWKPWASSRPLLTPLRRERERCLITAGWGWKSRLPMWSPLTLRVGEVQGLLPPSGNKGPSFPCWLHLTLPLMGNRELRHLLQLGKGGTLALYLAFAGVGKNAATVLVCDLWLE